MIRKKKNGIFWSNKVLELCVLCLDPSLKYVLLKQVLEVNSGDWNQKKVQKQALRIHANLKC